MERLVLQNLHLRLGSFRFAFLCQASVVVIHVRTFHADDRASKMTTCSHEKCPCTTIFATVLHGSEF